MCLLLNNIPQPEKANGVIEIPFNSAYVLRFTNKHNRRAVVKIYIDGENVSGGGYIIDAHSSINIKRHSDVDKAFQFVNLDSKAAKRAGKNGPNTNKSKGVIEARFYLEQDQVQTPPPVKKCIPIIYPDRQYHPYKQPTHPWVDPYKTPYEPYQPIWCRSINRNISSNSVNLSSTVCDFDDSSYSIQNKHTTKLSDGCTVKGSSTGQSFISSNIDIKDTYTSIKLFLQGYESTEKTSVYTEKVNSKYKYCDNCGAKAKKNSSNFCSICGYKF